MRKSSVTMLAKPTLPSVEVPKYKKKSPSNTSKAEKKSDHEHSYIDCILKDFTTFAGVVTPHSHLGLKCIICNKMVVTKYFITRKSDDGRGMTILTESEIKSRFKGLPAFNMV